MNFWQSRPRVMLQHLSHPSLSSPITPPPPPPFPTLLTPRPRSFCLDNVEACRGGGGGGGGGGGTPADDIGAGDGGGGAGKEEGGNRWEAGVLDGWGSAIFDAAPLGIFIGENF